MLKYVLFVFVIAFLTINVKISAQNQSVSDSLILQKPKISTDTTTTSFGCDNEIFVSAEQNPEFQGGISALYKFFADNVRVPFVMHNNGDDIWRVTIRFVVDKNGSVSNVEVIRGINPYCDKEALRVANLLPKFKPGKQNGRAVCVYYTIPVLFTSQNFQTKKSDSQKYPKNTDYYVNGKKVIGLDIKNIDPNIIESINVIKNTKPPQVRVTLKN